MTFPTFSSGEVLRAADMNAVGLWLIGSTTFTNTATPFINGCFTSDYQNYLVKVNLSASAIADVYFRMRSGVNTPEIGSVYDRFGFSWGTSANNLVSSNLVAGVIADIAAGGNNRCTGDVQIFSPNEIVHTMTTSVGWGSNSGAQWYPAHRIETTTQYTGIELTTLGAATLSGTMRVYGYRN
jgi:hypothetical protein